MKNLTLMLGMDLKFFGWRSKMADFFIITFDDSFNWSKQFIVSDNNALPILIVSGLTLDLELLRSLLYP